MKFQRVLEKYRAISFSEKDKGARFERLIQAFLKTVPWYEGKLRHIWLWNEFPCKQNIGGKDTGIDLVAQTVEGDFWAIQCKCWNESAYIDKPAVDSFLATSSKTFINDQLQTTAFALRLWISTTNNWNSEAENAIRHQNPPVRRINLTDLEEAPVDWEELDKGISGAEARTAKKILRDHQKNALENFHEHFKTGGRGKLIMACGTGKTFTALKIAERETSDNGFVLFLVPSIALLGQTLREWTAETDKPIFPICICSDPEVSRRKVKDSDGFSVEDLALPASTHVPDILKQLNSASNKTRGMTVVFSTYQSIDVIAKAQKEFGREFDLIICDEAHRTTGVTLKDDKDSAFVKIHDDNFIKAKKRLYMTATPRLYRESAKEKAKEADALLCSMDDEAMYGPEVYRIGFGEAVDKNLLSDYKVLVLTLNEREIPDALQKAIADKGREINTDDASKLIGCINALSKRMLVDESLIKASDPNPMRRAVAFCRTIEASKKITKIFNEHKDDYYNSLTQRERAELVGVSSDHIDGTMGAAKRDAKLSWLKNAPADSSECRILTNVRCLSEGVDVPSLDAVMFLSARNSEIDVVQSVGRVMRVAPGKKYGYIIIPVVVPAGVKPEDALNDNERFRVVWMILNALRAHDDRFDSMVNKLELNKQRPSGGGTVIIGGIGNPADIADSGDGKPPKPDQPFLPLPEIHNLQNAIYARMVQKVGNKRYWEQWAADVAKIAQSYIERIGRLIAVPGPHKTAFDDFLTGIRKNINPSVTPDEVVEMLAQHMITRPVFEALFENYSFVRNNPVSQALQGMIDLLEAQALEKDTIVLTRFYESVKRNVSGITDAAGRQKIIVELYEKFFKTAFPKTVEKLGIVYTPVEIVDFINHSVAAVLEKEFGRKLSDENVHILDPFTGTGTFITRLIQSGLIEPDALPRKYAEELHANEIVLLAYYIASINIESAYHDLVAAHVGANNYSPECRGEKFFAPTDDYGLAKAAEEKAPYVAYAPFPGICLTDTFQLGETEDANMLFTLKLQQNSERVVAQQKAPIRVIIGNPPYSVGQRSANDNAQNQSYPKLEKRIAGTYAAKSTATLKNSLYDAYIKAFRWSSDRLPEAQGGIIAFVSNAGWIDSNAMDGFRKCLEQEFSAIYVFNLRGNQRTSGETSRREGGKIFGSGSRTPIAITLLVKKPEHAGKAVIYYRDIGDYLNREEKLEIVDKSRGALHEKMEWQIIRPNEHADWLNQRNDLFGSFIPLGDKDSKDNKQTVFVPYYSRGLATSRDTWCYNSSKKNVHENMNRTIGFYNSEVDRFIEAKKVDKNIESINFIKFDSTNITWDQQQKIDIVKGKKYSFKKENVILSSYRPFHKQWCYFSSEVNNRVYQLPKLFPTPKQNNLTICLPANKNELPLLCNNIPDLHLNGDSQCFPLYYYEKKSAHQSTLFDADNDEYIRRDGLTDFILDRCRDSYGPKVTKEDIFYYVYGLLHSPDYRKQFAADLKKMLPRLPLVEKPADFWAFSKAGRELANLHLNYEEQPPCHAVTVTGAESGKFQVEKMRFGKFVGANNYSPHYSPSAGKDARAPREDKSVIEYNPWIKLSGIPLEAYEYVVNGRSAIEWIMERYQVKTDKDSGIKNDPNDWAAEHGKPRYILDLLSSIITVSLETIKIVNELPNVTFN